MKARRRLRVFFGGHQMPLFSRCSLPMSAKSLMRWQVSIGAAVFIVALIFICANGSAHAVTFDVTGSNILGQTLTETLDGDAALTNVTTVNLQVSGVSDPLVNVTRYVSPVLNACQ
jgi:hypothetical protein